MPKITGESKWVVIDFDQGPQFEADTKKVCLEWCANRALDPHPTTTRWVSGWYKYEHVPDDDVLLNVTEYFIARRSVVKARGHDYLLENHEDSHYRE